jgi:RNA-binding protein YlmH
MARRVMRRDTYAAHVKLASAYQNVFKGSPDQEQQELVLADLAAQSGFYKVSHSSLSSDALRQQEGKRELFGHIFAMLAMSAEDKHALEIAARHEAAAIDAS